MIISSVRTLTGFACLLWRDRVARALNTDGGRYIVSWPRVGAVSERQCTRTGMATAMMALLLLLLALPRYAQANLQPWTPYPALQAATVARPFLIVKCAFSDNPSARTLPAGLDPSITNLDAYIDLFLTTQGSNTGNLTDYWRDVSYGAISLAGNTVVGWVTAPFPTSNGLSRLARVTQCANAIPQATLANLSIASFAGIIIVTNTYADGGACATGKVPMTIGNTTYQLGCVVFDPGSMYTGFASHETGHALGLPHSFDNTTVVCGGGLAGQYCDQFDIMSALGTWQFYTSNWPPFIAETGRTSGLESGGSGPGPNAPNLLALNVMPAQRVATYNVPARGQTYAGNPAQTFVLAAMSHPNANGSLALKIVGSNPDDFYTVEYRQADGWDQGMAANLVLIHEDKVNASPNSFLQEGPTYPPGDLRFVHSSGWGGGTVWSNTTVAATLTVVSIDPTSNTATVAVGPLLAPAPNNCFANSSSYATVVIECYSYLNGAVVYDENDPMLLQRLDPGTGQWVVADDGTSNPWDTVPPRYSIPMFEDMSFQSYPTPPANATYRVCAQNAEGLACGANIAVALDLRVTPVSPPGNPICGPDSQPYRPCQAVQLPRGTGYGVPQPER
jgi:hypothetical protein